METAVSADSKADTAEQRLKALGVELPQVADGASELLQDVFGKERNPCRLVFGVASLPLGTPVEIELIFEVAAS
jgi:enamine deaminase RidA (YjgF/YER057c/UK114 family)